MKRITLIVLILLGIAAYAWANSGLLLLGVGGQGTTAAAPGGHFFMIDSTNYLLIDSTNKLNIDGAS